MERIVRRTRDRIETGRAAASSAEKRLDLSIRSRRAWSCGLRAELCSAPAMICFSANTRESTRADSRVECRS
jgi:hypothetical protein